MSLQLAAPAGAPTVVKEFRGQYEFLSNFFPRPVMFKINDFWFDFPSSEHAYQACKYKAMEDVRSQRELVEALQDEFDCTKAKHIAHKAKIDVDKWNSIKDGVMRAVVFEKFRQHADLQEKLLATGTAMLVEGNTWGDEYWGRVNGRGLNRLGSILMETRGYFFWKQQQELDRKLEK